MTRLVVFGSAILTFLSAASGCTTQTGTEKPNPDNLTGGSSTGGARSGNDSATGGWTTGGTMPSDALEPLWSDACSNDDGDDVLFTTNDEGCTVCRVLASEHEPDVFVAEIAGPRCGGPGLQLGSGWIGCGWVFTRAWGDQGDGPYEGRFKIVDPASGLGGASTNNEEPAEGELMLVDAFEVLNPEPPAECRYAVYGDEDFPTNCDSWKQVCCPQGTASDCDETSQPFD